MDALLKEELELNPKFVVDTRGKRRSVLLSIKEYDALLERLEDLEDALTLDEAIRTAKSFRPLAEITAGLKRAGRL